MKFGGASLRNPEAIQQAGKILSSWKNTAVLIVVSAMGKTTNALEQLSASAQLRKEEEAWMKYAEIEKFHLDIASALFQDKNNPVFSEIQDALDQISRILKGIILLEDFPDRTYDRIVSYGEILSSRIVHRYLESCGLKIEWQDARQLIRTDSDYRQAEVNWEITEANIQTQTAPRLTAGVSIITQGFIGSNALGRTTTLGREGSDYSAAIFAHCLNAEAQIVWKDVAGVMNADPAQNPDAEILPAISYEDAVRMTYFGASVIHSKTIRPLRNSGIPLLVKCFLAPEEPGTRIDSTESRLKSNILSRKNAQALIQIRSQDFSFMDAAKAASIFRSLDKAGIQVQLSHISGLDLWLITDQAQADKKELDILLSERFEVQTQSGFHLLTAELFSETECRQLEDKIQGEIIFSQRTGKSCHWLVR